jgi:hypothetical protein
MSPAATAAKCFSHVQKQKTGPAAPQRARQAQVGE